MTLLKMALTLSLFSLGCATHVPNFKACSRLPKGEGAVCATFVTKEVTYYTEEQTQTETDTAGTRFMTPENFGKIKAAFKECVIRKHCKIIGEKEDGNSSRMERSKVFQAR